MECNTQVCGKIIGYQYESTDAFAEKHISGVLAKEDGRPKININFAYGNNIIMVNDF